MSTRDLIAFAKRHGVSFGVVDDRLVITGLRRLSKRKQGEVRAAREAICGDVEGARILALPRETLRTMVAEGKAQHDLDMVEAGLRLPPIERVQLRPGRYPGHSTFVLERGKRYLPPGFE